MNFSDQWRSLWPVSSVFAAPNLLSAASSKLTGPLIFRPLPPPLTFLSSPSLALQVTPPLPSSSLLDGFHTFFRCPENEAFLPTAVQDSLAADVHSSLGDGDPIPANNLHALLCRDGSTLALLFPTGENAHSIGYLGLSFRGGTPDLRVDRDGGVFKQQEGFKHPYQRILKMSVAPTSASLSLAVDPELSDGSVVEGLLIATTLYSVNWFRVETRVSDSGQERPFLVPMAKQGFESSVVHACWSPHFPEESVVLLDNGDLCWFNLNTKRGGKVRVTLGGGDPGEWLSCEFGGQPWILMVSCSNAVLLVDLRSKIEAEPKLLARIDMLDLYCITSITEKNDRFLASCKASFSDFHIAVVSERQLLLFDTRQPLVPVLTWDHGLDRPSYVAMFRLSELRPSIEFKWASESGFAILVGSFWNDEFNLFCYGPREGGAHNNNSSLYAWELPSCIPLSGRQCGSGDHLLKDRFSMENFPDAIGWQQKDTFVGFCIVPGNLSILKPESGDFALIRLMLSGKLEMQSFHASWDSFSDNNSGKAEDSVEQKASITSCTNQGARVSTRYDFIKLRYLYEYMNGNLSNALVKPAHQSYHEEINQNSCSFDLIGLGNKLNSRTSSVSSFISDASIPTSIFEITLRRVLTRLQLDLLPLAFSKYSDLFRGNGDFSFEFLEVPSCLPHHNLPPFFTGKPLRRSEKWSKKALYGEESLVGPVLPLPVLLTLQQMFTGDNSPSFSKDESDDDLLTLECKTVLENVFPEISIADTGHEWDASQDMNEEKPFFVYEPTQMSNGSTCNINGCTATCTMKEELPQVDPMNQTSWIPEGATKDKKYTTFVCGIAERTHGPDFTQESVGIEMLDLSPVRLDFDSSTMVFQPQEQKIYKCLKKQFSKWQDEYKPYQDFCTSSKIPKLAQ